jgi:hypothetical protein
MNNFKPKFSTPFMPMKRLCHECGLAYKSLEAEVTRAKAKGIEIVDIEGIKYSVLPGRLKLNKRTYVWNAEVFYFYWLLPLSQQTLNSDRPLQVRSGNTVFFKQPMLTERSN